MRLQRIRKPVKVTAYLSSPLAGEPPMLDGLLEWLMLRHMPSIRQTSGGSRHMHHTNGGHVIVPIPIARDPLGTWLIPRASSPILDTVHADEARQFARPTVTDDSIIADRKKLNTSSGPNKSCLLPLRTRLVHRIVWFALAEGDGSKGRKTERRYGSSPRSRLRQRLKKIDAIGSKTAHGYGVIDRWEVEPVDHDCSWFAPHGDEVVLMRPLPVGDWLPSNIAGAMPDFDRPCGPYHDKRCACEVVKPC